MRSFIGTLLLLFVLSAAAALPEPQSVPIAVDVDATGHVTNADVRYTLPKATVQRLVERVMQFEFTPATRNGQPVPSSTTLWLDFAFEEVDREHLAIRIRDAYTGPGYGNKRVPVGFPKSAIRNRRDGDVWLRLSYDASGRVTKSTVLATRGDPAYGTSAVAATMQWTLIPERIDGEPVAGVVEVPVYFRINAGHGTRALPHERWVKPTDGATPPDNGRELVASSVVALQTSVAGSLL